MKAYFLYWLRAATLGAGLNAIIVGHLMSEHGLKFHQAVPLGALASVNCSFIADRFIFTKLTKKKEQATDKPKIGFRTN